jgi:thiamine monophosphate kinase
MSQQPTDNTTKILETAEKIVENVTKSDLVEIVEVGGKTTTTIFKDLLASGGKPVAVILAIAVVIVATAIPIVAFRLSPSQINLPATTSQIKQLE